MRLWPKWVGIAIVGLFLACQLLPVVRSNPPTDSTRTLYATAAVPPDVRSILERSCGDCHSNDTRWPWYSHVAPASWLVAFDVREGRTDLNFSDWARYPVETKGHKLEAICRRVRQGEMPDVKYMLIHRGARLSESDRETLCRWTEDARKALGPSLKPPSPSQTPDRDTGRRGPGGL
jgi:Haem-binding domain